MNDDDISQLEKLAELKNRGIISEEDFILKKRELLNIGSKENRNDQNNKINIESGSYWWPISSLVFGIICILALLDYNNLDKESMDGYGVFSFIGFSLGLTGVLSQKKGRGMSIAGIVISTVFFFVYLSDKS